MCIPCHLIHRVKWCYITEAGDLGEKLSDFLLNLMVLGIALEKLMFHVIVMSTQNMSIKIYSIKNPCFPLFWQYILSTPID